MSPLPSHELRRGGPQDVAAIRSLVRTAYAKWVPIIGREPRPMGADYEQAVRLHQFDVVYVASDLAGLIETEVRSDHVWIENIAVHPDHQGRGFGHRLLQLAEGKAQRAGLGETRLLTNGLMGANIRLYESVGYRIVAHEPYDGGIVVHMSKLL